MTPYIIPLIYISSIHFSAKYHYYININGKQKLLYNISLSLISLFLFIDTIINIETPIYELLCYKSSHRFQRSSFLFFLLKFVEWFDSILLVVKYEGDTSKISNLHYIHHAIVPTMTFYGNGQPGEVYVLLTNNLAHFLMYGYYSSPKNLGIFKKYITQYQYIQHLGAVTLILYQYINQCNVSYPLINVVGYCYFFYEYLNLLPQIKVNTKSSLIFATNVIHLIGTHDQIYLYSWILLFISSVTYHQTYNRYLQLIDKIFAYNIIFQGGIRFISQEFDTSNLLCLLCFITVSVLYYIENNYVSNVTIKEYCHGILHLLSSIGHHIIIHKLT